MGKQYISTATAADGHLLDILDVAVTARYTVTVSSDGYAAFWDNKQEENHDPHEYVKRLLVNKMGLHHVTTFETVLPSSHVKILLLGFAAFDGSITLKLIVGDDYDSLKDIEAPAALNKNCWCPCFHEDPESKNNHLVVARIGSGATVYRLNIATEGDVKVLLEEYGHLVGSNGAFPNSIDISYSTEAKVAIGHPNGDVLLYDLDTLKPYYTFRSTDLQQTASSGSSSIARVVKFSPGGSLLAVARDNQSSGSITLYDVKYGEDVGSLTTPSHSSKTTIGGFAHEGWVMGLCFDETGDLLASSGFDKCVRIWNLDTREREATINISVSDLENAAGEDLDTSVASGVRFIKKGIRGGSGGDTNEGLCVVSFDRGIRWYREAGGI